MTTEITGSQGIHFISSESEFITINYMLDKIKSGWNLHLLCKSALC